MLTEIHPIMCDDIHYIDSQPFEVAEDYWFLFCFIKIKDRFDTHILYTIILQKYPSIIVMNFYLLSIQKAPFIIVTMLTRYKCWENFTPEPNIYRGWIVPTYEETVKGVDFGSTNFRFKVRPHIWIYLSILNFNSNAIKCRWWFLKKA